ncbi:hypothetical protein [Pseudonocardia sp. HH130629-09]|uniref:hypothetical protein n=1 Tax=Pseudonocardia sp. HH130629-09 TaxID=1641402 RepID=UPI001439E8C2|nr:hypothetical protein [Pseudonocardia sp. HH130629-09]
MSAITVRPFRRSDRDQLTDLVNGHAHAVMPGVSITVNAVLSRLEHEPDEFIVDPWVQERATLVAEQRGRKSRLPTWSATPTTPASAPTCVARANSGGSCSGPTRPTGPTPNWRAAPWPMRR